MFLGFLIAFPDTVTTFSIKGFPFTTASYIAAAVPVFCTTTPTADGSCPDGTCLSKIDLISCFSPPCGYFVFNGTIFISVPSVAFS